MRDQRLSLARVVALVVLVITALLGSATAAVAQETEAEISARGTVRGAVEGTSIPLEGVRVVASSGDEVVAEATTNDRGQWEMSLPEVGEYIISLDTDTLPPGTEAADEPLTVAEITEGRNTVVLTPTTTAEGVALASVDGSGLSGFERFATLTAQGLKLGLVLALMAVGLSMIYSVTGLVNFAHGELVTLGAVGTYILHVDVGLPLVVAGVLVTVAGLGVGWGNEVGIWAPLRRRRSGRISLIVVSIGLSIVVRHLYLVLYDSGSNKYTDFTSQTASTFGPISMPVHDIWIMGICIALLVATGAVLQFTRIGTAIRAVADNPDLASASGIDVARIIRVVWMIGASLAMAGGIMQGLTEAVVWDMGFKLLLLIFSAVILGGIGTAFGAMVGGIVIGIMTQTSTYWIDNELKVAVALAVMIAVLLVRPQGILGQKERVG